MVRSLRSLLSVAAILALASAASAAPFLTYSTTAVGNVLTAYDFTFNANDSLGGAAFVSITFSSSAGINQEQWESSSRGTPTGNFFSVDSQSVAATDDGDWGSGSNQTYYKAQDSWFYEPWDQNSGPNQANFNNGAIPGVGTTATTYGIIAGTGGGSNVTNLLLAHIVTTGSVSWSGTDSRDQTYPISGTTAVPEPASLAVLSLGALALMARKRRRA